MTLERGFFVQVAGEWYPVDGLCLTHYPGGAVDGSVFTLKPNGRPFEPCLGYRIEYSEIAQIAERQP